MSQQDARILKPGSLQKIAFNPALMAQFDAKTTSGSLAVFDDLFDDNESIFKFVHPRKAGDFKYDPDDTNSADDRGELVLVKNGKRFKRIHNGVFSPAWFDIDETGTTNVGAALTSMFIKANANKAEVEANGTYLIDEAANNYSVLVYTDLRGHGTFLTRKGATLSVMKSFVTVENISIDGGDTGRGLYNDGWQYVTARGVKVQNVQNQGFWFRRAHYSRINGCTTRRTLGAFGDGIYVAYARNTQIHNNMVTEYQRIGITCEGSDVNSEYTYSFIITNNTVKTAIMTISEGSYPNGAIWCENVAGGIIMGNVTDDSRFRGIAISPSIQDGKKYKYIISNNSVKNVRSSSPGFGVGYAVVYATGCSIMMSNNYAIDCERGYAVGDHDLAIIDNCYFQLEDQVASWTSLFALVQPLTDQNDDTRKSVTIIRNCHNEVVHPTRGAIAYANLQYSRGDITVENNSGSMGFIMNTANRLTGNVTIRNSYQDLSTVTAANSVMVNITGKYILDNVHIKMPAVGLLPYCGEMQVLNNSLITCDVQTRLTIYLYATSNILVKDSTLDNVYFFDMRSPNMKVRFINSEFLRYSTTEGVMQNTPALLDELTVLNCRFDPNITAIPIRVNGGVTKSEIGNNLYYSKYLTTGFTPKTQPRTMAWGTTSAMPVLTEEMVGYEYFDQNIKLMRRWMGDYWFTPPSYFVSDTVSPLGKAYLNSTYGQHKAGTIVYCPDISTGKRKYIKLTDALSSDWEIITAITIAG